MALAAGHIEWNRRYWAALKLHRTARERELTPEEQYKVAHARPPWPRCPRPPATPAPARPPAQTQRPPSVERHAGRRSIGWITTGTCGGSRTTRSSRRSRLPPRPACPISTG